MKHRQKPRPVKIQAKPLEQLLVPQLLVQHLAPKRQAQTQEHPAPQAQKILGRIRRTPTILATPGIQGLQAIQAPQEHLETLATPEHRARPQTRTVLRKVPASPSLRSANSTASTARAQVRMILDKTTIQVSTMIQVNTNPSHTCPGHVPAVS